MILNKRALARRFEEALASFDQVIALRPDHVNAFYNRGIVLGELFEEALTSYEQAVGLRPNFTPSRL